MKNKGLTIIFGLSAFLFTMPTAFAAVLFNLTPQNQSVYTGHTFKLTIGADPAGVNSYTIKAGVKFPPELLAVQDWKPAEGWMPLVQNQYDYQNNAQGLIIKTSGFPAGFSSGRDFCVLTFLAKKAGTAVIEFDPASSFALNESNQNLFAGGNKAIITITDAPA